MTTSNYAAWLDGKGEKVRVGPAPMVKPGKGEVLIKVHAVAINPADWHIQDTGMFIQHWPHAFGEDAAGEVVELGEGVSSLSVGQRVTTCVLGSATGRDECCAFANFVIAPEVVTCPIDHTLDYGPACVFPLATCTAAAGLYWPTALALPYPTTDPRKSNKSLILWGGSTSVGCMVIQLATASGINVIATASPRNFYQCKFLGAIEVFDYNSDSVKEDILRAVKGTECVGAYNAVPSEEAQKALGQILGDLGGGFIANAGVLTADNLSYPPGVTTEFANSMRFAGGDEKATRAIWKDFMPVALASRQVVSAPDGRTVGDGLESVQAALDWHRKGVSATKLIVHVIPS